MSRPDDSARRTPDERERSQRDKYEDVSADDVAEDAIEFMGEGGDDPSPAVPSTDTAPAADDEQPPPPNA